MSPAYFAAEGGTNVLEALGVNLTAFIIQLATFLLFFILLKKFAVTPIIRLLEKRRRIIDDGVHLGRKMEHEHEELEEKIAQQLRVARHEADRIIAGAHKEAREIIREAGKTAHHKANAMLADAQARIEEDSKQARRKLEKDLVGLISEATEAIVDEKIDPKKDAELINKALKGHK